MQNSLNSVREFMEAMDQPIRHTPVTQLSIEETMFRCHLLREMFNELRESLGVYEDEFGWSMKEVRKPLDPAKLLDSLSDTLYVVLGLYHTLGLASVADAAFDEVHRANMTKKDPATGKFLKDLNGRVLKGPNYRHPDFTAILESLQKLSGTEIFKQSK